MNTIIKDMPLGRVGIRIMKSAIAAVFLVMVLIAVTATVLTVSGGIENTIKAIGGNPVSLVLWIVFPAVIGNLWHFFDQLEEDAQARANKARYAGVPARKR